ncbi:hypothetical protein [Neobacillus vireti]|uniref:hypothetical protein n=1 Tax=Neobacillus vireti TaxID=220686 RepID=UPI002FFE1D73
MKDRIANGDIYPKELRKVYKIGQKTMEEWIDQGILKVSYTKENKNGSVTR